MAAPRSWEEVDRGADGGRFEQVLLEDALGRLEREGDLAATLLDG